MNIVHCKKDPFDVYVGRPSVWGNPFSHKDSKYAARCRTVQEALDNFHYKLQKEPAFVASIKRSLHDKILACWCAPVGGVDIDAKLVCHAQLLARAARGDYDGINS
jgi:hypothetical protein